MGKRWNYPLFPPTFSLSQHQRQNYNPRFSQVLYHCDTLLVIKIEVLTNGQIIASCYQKQICWTSLTNIFTWGNYALFPQTFSLSSHQRQNYNPWFSQVLYHCDTPLVIKIEVLTNGQIIASCYQKQICWTSLTNIFTWAKDGTMHFFPQHFLSPSISGTIITLDLVKCSIIVIPSWS
jgi:hypothetical protein